MAMMGFDATDDRQTEVPFQACLGARADSEIYRRMHRDARTQDEWAHCGFRLTHSLASVQRSMVATMDVSTRTVMTGTA